jgi:hypothetical protein
MEMRGRRVAGVANATEDLAGRVDGHPAFTAQREVDDGPVELFRHGLMLGAAQDRSWERSAVDRRAGEAGNLSG